MNRIASTVLAPVLLLASLAVTAEETKSPPIPQSASEPTKCFRLLANSGMELPAGILVDACGGSVDAVKTVSCLVEAWSPRADGGLGLSVGLGVDLCRAGGKRQP
jgi:hypothetical protein